MLPVGFSHHSGVFVYAQRILQGWHDSGITDITVLTTSWLAESVLKPICPTYDYIKVDVPNIPGYTRRCLGVMFKRLKAINNSGCDIVFYPMPEPFFFMTPRIPQVTVIHDTAYPKSPTYHKKILLPWQIAHSKKIVAISNTTKQSALKVYKFLKDNKVEVVHNAVAYETKEFPPVLDYKYILCVNTLYEYKNPDTLIMAFGIIKDKISEDLVFVGSDTDGRWEMLTRIAREYGVDDRIHHLQGVSSEELISLYQHATLFVSPSLMEGFGQTPIEAAIYGTPVITTEESALPESTLGLVNYYSPAMSETSLADKILEVLTKYPTQEALDSISLKFKNAYDVVGQSKKVYNVIKATYEESINKHSK